MVVVVLVMFAGCAQVPENQTDTTELSSRMLIVDEEKTTTVGNETIRFKELSPEQQRVFERALDKPNQNVRIPSGVDYEVWEEHRYVRYRNETYSVLVAVP